MSDFPLPDNSNEIGHQMALVTGATSSLEWLFARVLTAAEAEVAIVVRQEVKLPECGHGTTITFDDAQAARYEVTGFGVLF